MPPAILIVEDDEDTREYFADVLRDDEGGYSVTTAASLAAAMEALSRSTPDVVLVDLGLPDGSGLDMIRHVRKQSPETLALVITVFGDERSVIGAIEAGARGYLLKAEGADDLRLSVRQVLSGGAPISPGIASHLLRRFTSPEQARDTAGGGLTPREREVLELIVRGLSYKESADVLGIAHSTLTSHVKHIYRKLEVGSRGEAVFEALSQGIVKVDSGR